MKHITKEKGDVATTQVIADLTKKGYDLFIPISEHLSFDLVAHKDGQLFKIQCKYIATGHLPNKTTWSDQNGIHNKKYSKEDFDYYGAFIPEKNVCVYPSSLFMGAKISWQNPNSAMPFYWYEDFLDFTDQATKKNFKDFGVELHPQQTKKSKDFHISRRKVERPSKEELEILLWEKPTVHIALELGVSDKAIEKWAQSYNLSKPPRGYWLKKKYNKA